MGSYTSPAAPGIVAREMARTSLTEALRLVERAVERDAMHSEANALRWLRESAVLDPRRRPA